MVTEMMNTIVSLVMLAAVTWLIISIAGIWFSPLRRLRRLYSKLIWSSLGLLWRGIVAIYKWLLPDRTRTGPAHMHAPGRLRNTGQEDEPWYR
jgi:hypothetical protein